MKNYRIPALFSLVFCAALFSCTKEKIVEKDVIKEVEKPAAVNITITSPTGNDVIQHGDTVHIKALLTGVNTLHGYEVSVRNTDLHDEVLFLASVHTHNTVINVDTFWVNDLNTAASLSANVSAFIDHEGNFIGKKAAFSVK